jgi:gluconokinase
MRRPPRSLVLAIDIGSSSVRSALFDERARRLPETLAHRPYAIRYSAGGAAELDAALLLRSTRACVRETLRDNAAARVAAVAGCGFWHGLLGLDRAERPITAVYTWADARSKADAAQLRRELDEGQIQLRTGCMLRAQFWPAKLRWLRRTNARLFRAVRRWTSPAAWIFGELFGVDAVSHSMASATGLYALESRDWDVRLCELCGIRPDQLDRIDHAASTARSYRQLRNARVFPAIGDGAASNLGSGADREGVAALNIGTSGAVRLVVPNARRAAEGTPAGLFRYVLDDARDVLGGAMSNAGNLHKWCMRELKIDPDGAERALQRIGAARDGLTVLPFWVDERAPSWPEAAPSAVIGLTQMTTASDILRAVTTSTFYRLTEILDRLTTAVTVKDVIVSGGILRSPASMRVLADCLGRDIRVCSELESSLRGAAVNALKTLGFTPASLRAGKLVRCNSAWAALHRVRRARQTALEQLLENGEELRRGV